MYNVYRRGPSSKDLLYSEVMKVDTDGLEKIGIYQQSRNADVLTVIEFLWPLNV